MLTKLKNKLEDFAKERMGEEILDRDILAFLQQKHKEELEFPGGVVPARFLLEQYFHDLELREELLRDKAALDIGSSSHFFDEYCEKRYGTHFVALDIEEATLKKNHPAGVVADARVLPFQEQAFDLVISHASMPHWFTPYRDADGKMTPIEGEAKRESIEDMLALFREVYRVLKKGGQIRMSTFSEKEELSNRRKRKGRVFGRGVSNERMMYEEEMSHYQIARINLVKEALSIFEQEVGEGARCMFKDEEKGGLIVIVKL